MSFASGSERQASDLNWRTLRAYARAMRDFTRTARPELGRQSFRRIEAAGQADLPPPAFFEVPGCRLGYRHYEARTSRRCLVLVHGSGCFGDLYNVMARQLAERDLAHVVTVDMRGHGLSGGRRGHAVDSPGQMVDDLARFIMHLRELLPGCRMILGGHSAGGGLVLAFARSPVQSLVSAYLFIAPYLGLGSAVNRSHFGGWVRLHQVRMTMLTVANLFGIRRFNDMTAVDFAMSAAQDPRYVASWSFNTMLAFGPGRWLADAAPLPARKPVLVLAGEADECFAAPLFREAFGTVAPHAEIPRVGPLGHWDILVDAHAIALVGDWIARQREPRRKPVPAAPRALRAA